MVDTSFFVSANAVNPTLTTVANALRVGDHLMERLGARGASPDVSPPSALDAGHKAAESLA